MALFKDFDMSFLAHPLRKDIAILTDNNSVKNAVKNILKTVNYERPFEPSFGTIINNLLFEPMTPATTVAIKTTVETALTTFEPRIFLREVEVEPNYDNARYEVTIFYHLVNVDEPQEFVLFLERPR